MIENNLGKDRAVHERYGIIGGSSLGNFYSNTPWGCLRKLAYTYTGEKNTHEKEYNEAMKLGHFFEPTLRDWFSETIKDTCYEGDFVVHPELPFLGGHPDGVFGKDGIIEIKTASAYSYNKLREKGIYDSYKDQLTLYMSITERYDAYFVVGSSLNIKERFIEKFEWEQERYDRIVRKTTDFVIEICKGNLPPRCGKRKRGLVAACRRCEFRGKCLPPIILEEIEWLK